MKPKLSLLILTLSAALAFGHGGVELGPNGGRILEFSKNESLHGEVVAKEGKFHIALLDKDMRPVATEESTLTVTTGDRNNPQKLAVTKDDKGFTLPLVKEGETLILQFKRDAKAKAVTARFAYDTSECDACDAPEWICRCEAAKK